VDDLSALLTVNHVGIKAAAPFCLKFPNPGDSLPPMRVDIRVVKDVKVNIRASLGEHDAAPGPYVEKWQRVQRTMPNLVHHTPTYGSHFIFTRKPKAPLDLGMEPSEIRAQDTFVYRFHRRRVTMAGGGDSGSPTAGPFR